MRTQYFAPAWPRILAHRGLTQGGLDENTKEALESALAHGAEYLEIDVRASSDGVAFVLHDADLRRMANLERKVSELAAAELDVLRLSGGGSPLRLAKAFEYFPTAKFNIDVKSADAIEPVRACILEAGCEDRVLISSFSDRRRLKTSRGLAIANGAGWQTTLLARLSYRFRPALSFVLRNTDALQIPISFGPIRLDRARFIEAVSALGVEVHFWVINDIDQAKHLISMGAKGIVTDRADLILPALAE